MRVVFFGTPSGAVPTLEAIVAAGHAVPLVVTRPDRPVGRSRRPQPPPVKTAAIGHRLEVAQPDKVRGSEFSEVLEAANPDVLVVVAYGKILPRRILSAGALGAVNVHFSLLPSYRGAAPVQWALAESDTVTGITTMLMNERLDEGDVLLQETLEVRPGEHAPSLTERLSVVGADLLTRTLTGLETSSLRPVPQDHAAATYAPMLKREDGAADFSLTAGRLTGRIRGFDPWPGVWTRCRGRRVRIVEATESDVVVAPRPGGLVLGVEDDLATIACGQGTVLAVRKLQPEGRKVMTVREALNGRYLAVGDLLESAAETG